MGVRVDVLDHGYAELMEAWGTGDEGSRLPSARPDYEVGIIEAARQSTQKGFQGWDADLKLLEYLYKHKHWTPFEFAGLVVEVQAPIFVFREWHRHRTQSYNEMSARYAPLPDLYYEPHQDHVVGRAMEAWDAKNKQASSARRPDVDRIARWVEKDRHFSRVLEDHYQEGLSCGVPKELARKKMPVDHYSRMRASANLRNWLAFMTLRCDPAAQWEIRQFANAVNAIVQTAFPRTHRLWWEATWDSEYHEPRRIS